MFGWVWTSIFFWRRADVTFALIKLCLRWRDSIEIKCHGWCMVLWYQAPVVWSGRYRLGIIVISFGKIKINGPRPPKYT